MTTGFAAIVPSLGGSERGKGGAVEATDASPFSSFAVADCGAAGGFKLDG